MVMVFDSDMDPPRQAGRFHCAGCLAKTVFWISEGQEYAELPDLECSSCGFEYVSITNEQTGEVKHQIGHEMREKALKEFIEEQQAALLRSGFVSEDVTRVVGTPE